MKYNTLNTLKTWVLFQDAGIRLKRLLTRLNIRKISSGLVFWKEGTRWSIWRSHQCPTSAPHIRYSGQRRALPSSLFLFNAPLLVGWSTVFTISTLFPLEEAVGSEGEPWRSWNRIKTLLTVHFMERLVS